MAKDISEELYAKIKESFDVKYEKAQLLGEPLHDVLARIQSGGGTFRDADMYSVEVGSILSDSLKENLILDEMPNKTFYRNIAKKTLGESLKDGYGMVSNIAAVVQEEMNASIGIGLKAVKPKLDVQAVDKIVNNAAQAETQEELDAVLTEPVKTFTRRVVDDTQKANARLHNKAGLAVKVEREYDGVGIHNQTEACQWCLDRDGKFTYEEAMDKGAFERHDGCGCIITYTSKKGDVTVSDSKYRGWEKPEDREARIAKEQEKRLMSGGRILNPNDEYERRWAKSYYEEIRHKTTDCEKIAERLGIDKKEIEEIKDYLFFSGTWYNEITQRDEPFVPDAAIAQSWQRLAEAKELAPHDTLLIQHERYEMQLKREHPEMSHDEAHALATKKYDYQRESDKYYADLRERKKRK